MAGYANAEAESPRTEVETNEKFGENSAVIQAYLRACTHSYKRAYIHTCIHACIHTYIHVCIHT